MCAFAIYTAMASVGKTCFPDENPQYQAELNELAGRLEAYVVRNSKALTPDRLAEFKRQQGYAGATREQLCKGDPMQMYRAIEASDRKAGRAEMDRMLARDGEPSWGTCL